MATTKTTTETAATTEATTTEATTTVTAALANVEVLKEPTSTEHADRFPTHVLPGAKTKRPNGLVLESF